MLVVLTALTGVLLSLRPGPDRLQAAQPALLYIVPAVLAAVALHAWARGEFLQVLEPPSSSTAILLFYCNLLSFKLCVAYLSQASFLCCGHDVQQCYLLPAPCCSL